LISDPGITLMVHSPQKPRASFCRYLKPIRGRSAFDRSATPLPVGSNRIPCLIKGGETFEFECSRIVNRILLNFLHPGKDSNIGLLDIS
jgi:hypothetical protein